MLEVLQFIFSSFWIWLGTLFLIVAFGESLRGTMNCVWRKREGE